MTIPAPLQPIIATIRQKAFDLHAHVNQTYDGKPYATHLQMVADAAIAYVDTILATNDDILPIIFAAYYHDSIEDARLTYNDVTREAALHMSPDQAYMAAEIVYALTNEKGRTRAERADERYYQGIRQTPYAPFIKLCDRLANMTYSFMGTNPANNHMHKVYAQEWPHFRDAITVSSPDKRFTLPQSMITAVESLF